MKTFLTVGITAVLASGLAFSALAHASSTDTEISTAHAHALMAQNANSMDTTRTHLHHVINCLVGPDGEAFDASAGNPCKGQGDGALPDSKGNQALHSKLQNALSEAQAGLNADSLAAAHSDAAQAAAALQATPTQKSSGGYSW